MSVLRPLLSMRGRLVFVATALLLIAALVAAPSVSGAKAAVKQFLATITPTTATGGTPGAWTERVTNCGEPVVSPCTASSTIGLGTIRIAVPTEFRPALVVSVVTSPSARNWGASYDLVTGNINAAAATGSDKLGPGEFVEIRFSATPTVAACGPGTFTTAAWGSASVPGTDPFQIKTPQPAVTVANEGCLESGGSVTGPGGQIETIEGDFTGHVSVTFGGPQPDCSSEAGFGALGAQWEVYHLPNPVTITPAADFVPGGPKVSTSEFPLSTAPGGPDADSSWYLICYAVPQAGHTAFETRGGGTAVPQTIGGVPSFVGILASCADAPIPCVSEQFLTTGPDAPPWNPGDNMVHIAITIAPGDPHKR